MKQVEFHKIFLSLLKKVGAHPLDMKFLLMLLDDEQTLQLLNWSVQAYPEDKQYPSLKEIIKKAIAIRKEADEFNGELSAKILEP